MTDSNQTPLMTDLNQTLVVADLKQAPVMTDLKKTYEIDLDMQNYFGRAKLFHTTIDLTDCKGTHIIKRDADFIDGLFLFSMPSWVKISKIYLLFQNGSQCYFQIPVNSCQSLIMNGIGSMIHMPSELNLIKEKIPIFSLKYDVLSLVVEIEPNSNHLGSIDIQFIQEHTYVKENTISCDSSQNITDSTRLVIKNQMGTFETI